MAQYRATFNTNISIDVVVDAADDDHAAEIGWEIAQAYLNTLGTQTGDPRIVSVESSLDGVGADDVIPAEASR